MNNILRRRVLPMPGLGPIQVIASDAGVCAVGLGDGDQPLLRHWLAARWTLVTGSDAILEQAVRTLEAYGVGRRDLPECPLDLRFVSPFTARVLAQTRRIPFGSVISYGDLAARIGCPGGARAVGGAMGRNPVPILIPCHRVVGSGSTAGGFSPGVALKLRLLRHEGVNLREGHLVPARELQTAAMEA